MAVHTAKVHDVLKGVKTYGTTVLVDRLWPRGVAKEDLQPDLWFKDAAPSADLRKWFNHEPSRFGEFAKRYREELETPGREDVEKLIDVASRGAVTLLYAAADREHNHAIVLADWLKK